MFVCFLFHNIYHLSECACDLGKLFKVANERPLIFEQAFKSHKRDISEFHKNIIYSDEIFMGTILQFFCEGNYEKNRHWNWSGMLWPEIALEAPPTHLHPHHHPPTHPHQWPLMVIDHH